MNQVIRPKDLHRLLGVSAMTVHRWRKSGVFPQPIPLGPNSVGYLQTDINTWLSERAAERDAPQNKRGSIPPAPAKAEAIE